MKQRLLVMNGQRLVQSELEGKWITNKVDKAGAIKPGIYDIYLAKPAEPGKSYDGVIVHMDKDSVFQQVGKTIIRHEGKGFDRGPDLGSVLCIKYDNGHVFLAASSVKNVRGLSR